MAREIDQIMQELESAYAPQKKQYQEQISALPSYYQAQAAGLEQARQNAFQDITRRANARGVVYSGAPIQEQQVYTGERYLPALAGLRQQEGTQTFNLQQALGKLGETQRLRAEEIRQQELNREEAARQAEANRRAAAAAYGGFDGLGNLFGGGGGMQEQAAPQLQPPSDIGGWQRLLNELRNSGLNYGQAVAEVYKRYGLREGDIQSGSTADQAFRNVFLGPTPVQKMVVQSVVPNYLKVIR